LLCARLAQRRNGKAARLITSIKGKYSNEVVLATGLEQ
jgi:hypothetical protein